MKRFIAITIAGAALAALAGPRGPFGGFWAPAPTAPHIHGLLLAGFVTENMVENLAFGLGLAILLLGRRWYTAPIPSTAKATTGWLATVWLFASWMPHAALHLHVGMQPATLLPIEWVFHAGTIAAIATLLWALSNPLGQTSTADGHTTATSSRTTVEHPT
jgi:hypothetical protein